MAEIWSPGTSFQDVWTHKFSALYLLYFRSYEIFSGGKSGTKIGLELKELKFLKMIGHTNFQLSLLYFQRYETVS